MRLAKHKLLRKKHTESMGRIVRDSFCDNQAMDSLFGYSSTVECVFWEHEATGRHCLPKLASLVNSLFGHIVDDEVILEIKPMKIDLVEYVQLLAKKATHLNTETPDSALKYSQAALNLAHAMAVVNAIKEA